MINLFDKFDSPSRDLLFSERVAKLQIPTVVINDDGYTPDEIDSPMKEYCGLVSNRKPVYFDEVKIPRFWRNEGKADHATIYDLDRIRGRILYAAGNNTRFVRDVQWFDEFGKITWVDHYSQHGQLFSKTYYDNGQPVTTNYYDRHGNEVLSNNLRAGDVFMDVNGRRRHFPNMSAFTKFYLEEKHYKLDHILYNTLDKSFGTSFQLPATEGTDVLFWHEKLGDDLPGNMKMMFDSKDPLRTKNIVFQDYRDWTSKQAIIPQDSSINVRYLGMIYPHPRGNKLRPNALVFTNTDQVEQLENLVKLMPNIQFHVAAITEMSSKLLTIGKYPNAHMYPGILPDKIKELVADCDIYLDINHGNEILDAVRGAFEQNMLILGFKDTIHEPKFVAQENIFDSNPEGAQAMAGQIKGSLVSPDLMKQKIDQQRQEASDVYAEDYQKAFEELFNV
ncbi:accessory Sec system glycosylation chaperone GtfB [uncultured Limosilactobacillus sp.]|uniref:accessory Sec system glycosylation chaperone GtfB n=1 Tax=uncultured Limosilactobacillus sp. TaxID=2837629 RepID=UPI0025FECE3E|nr:accessory Sec system glycosylation chaperone GtfB [uncultured Limosilactobacillus sp.]